MYSTACYILKYMFYVKKELLYLLGVYSKSATSAQTDGGLAAGGPLYTGLFIWDLTIITDFRYSGKFKYFIAAAW